MLHASCKWLIVCSYHGRCLCFGYSLDHEDCQNMLKSFDTFQHIHSFPSKSTWRSMGDGWTDSSKSSICQREYTSCEIAVCRKTEQEQMLHRCHLATWGHRVVARRWGCRQFQGWPRCLWCLRRWLRLGPPSFWCWTSIIYTNLRRRGTSWFWWVRHIHASDTHVYHGYKTSLPHHILPSIWQRLRAHSWRAQPYASLETSCSQRYPHLAKDRYPWQSTLSWRTVSFSPRLLVLAPSSSYLLAD